MHYKALVLQSRRSRRHKMAGTVPGIFAAVILITIRTSDAATCATNFSSSSFVNDFGFSASHESVKNKANDAFTVGWCAGINSGSSIQPTLDVDFKHPYGIKSIIVGSPTNRDSYPYPTNVLVKYIPNGGNAFVHFPLAEGKLEIKLEGPRSAQTSFSQAIAAKKLQFTIQSYHGEDACLRIELVGCVENDLCSGVCQNGGLCMYEDMCQCAGGFLGNHCQLSGCTPQSLGLATGAIKPDQITVSSEDPANNKTEIGNAPNKNGWCPLPSDQHPWVTIKLDEPKAVSVFSFNWASHTNTQIMTEFELQYVAPVDSSKRFRTFATDIPSMNGTHSFTVSTVPAVVTDTIRILPTKSIGRSCFKLEISGCDPTTLCSAGWCLNNGSCMGENVCRCPANFFGDRCEQTRNDIVHTDLTFVNITNNIIITTSTTLQFHITGNVVLQTIENKPVVIITGTSSSIQLSSTTGTPSCVTDINHCTNGFTFIVDIKFISIVDNTYIVSSGGNVPGHTGVTLFYSSNTLHYIVSNTNSIWTLIVPYKPMLNIWQHFEITWHKNLGVELIVNGHSLGTNSRPAPQQATAVTLPLCIGCSHTNLNVNINMQVTGILSWSIDRTELVNAGIKDPPSQSTTSAPATSTATTAQSTSTKAPTTSPTTTIPTTTPTTTTSTTTLPTTTAIPVPIFTWNFTSIVNNTIIGIEYNLTVHGTPVVVEGGLLINSSTQYIEFGKPKQNCLTSPESCIHGLTIQFTLQINKFEENTYFFTSGGQLPDGVGIAVIYRFGRIQFILTTNTSSWFISVTKNHFKPNQYYNITISWNLTIGLEVFVNNILIDSNKVPDNHQTALLNATTIYIGKQPDTSVKVEFVLNVVTIWYVHIDILVEQGKCEPPVRPTAPPSTTTNRPTTTQKQTTTASTITSSTTAKATFTTVMTKTTPQDQCPAGCVSIATGTSQQTTTQTHAPTAAPTSTSTTPTSTSTKQSTTRTTSTTAKPQPTATSAPIRPTPDTATPPPPSTRHPIPDYNVKPVIHVTVEKDKNAYLVCTFEPAKQTGVEITVSLIVEQKVVFVLSVGGNTGEAMFEVSKVNMFLYQKKIQCSVSAKWIGSSVTTITYYSNIFVPIITVKPGTLTVTEGHSKEFITVNSTIPPQFFCCDGCKAQCQVHIVGTFIYDRYFQTCGRDVIAQALIEGTKPSNFNEQICGYTLTIDNWNQENKIQIIATVDNRRDGDHRNTLEVVANVYNQPQTAQITVKPNVYTVTTVQVTIKDNDLSPAICKSVNDPHMTTFDGQRYDNMVEGEFILYRHLSLPFEVRALYHKCSSRSHATCNCAVAVKSGDDVITITGCQGTVSGGHPGQGNGLGLIFQQIFGSHGNANGHNNNEELAKTPMTIQIYKNGELTPGTHIRRIGCGQKYEILLPTGMIVVVEQSWKPFINIWITASSFDRGNTEGLCGNFDCNAGNDIKGNVNSFIQQWKAPAGYFFFGVGVSSHTVTSNFCSCVKDKNKICLPGLGAMRCESYRVDSDITATLVLHAKLPILTRTKRQAVVATDAPNTDIVPDAVQMSYEQAVRNCTDAIVNNTVTKACTPILTANISEQIENCAHDYNATGNFEWATDALRDIVVDCVNTANMLKAANASGNSNVTDELPPMPDNIDDILGKACVDKCSGHSNCTNGVCVCNPGYSGVTCDISKQTTPTVAQAPYMCDISVTSDCMAAVMYGDNFVESDDLTCHFEYVQVSDKVTPTGETGKSKAVYISINQVTCLLPKLQSARISISNDGKTLSNMSSIHVAYNSICHDCSAEDSTSVPSCSRKGNNCVINGVCFAEGDTRPGDNCQVCKSAANSSEWSKNTIAECIPMPVEAEKVSSDDDKKKVLALAIVCGVLAAILLIALIYALRVRAAKKSSKGEYGEYDVASQQHKLHRNDYDNPVMYENNPTYNEKM